MIWEPQMVSITGCTLHKHSLTRCAWIAAASCLLLSACATTNLPAIGEPGKAFERADDEQVLWQRAERLEKTIAKSGFLYDDARRCLTALTQRSIHEAT